VRRHAGQGVKLPRMYSDWRFAVLKVQGRGGRAQKSGWRGLNDRADSYGEGGFKQIPWGNCRGGRILKPEYEWQMADGGLETESGHGWDRLHRPPEKEKKKYEVRRSSYIPDAAPLHPYYKVGSTTV